MPGCSPSPPRPLSTHHSVIQWPPHPELPESRAGQAVPFQLLPGLLLAARLHRDASSEPSGWRPVWRLFLSAPAPPSELLCGLCLQPTRSCLFCPPRRGPWPVLLQLSLGPRQPNAGDCTEPYRATPLQAEGHLSRRHGPWVGSAAAPRVCGGLQRPS